MSGATRHSPSSRVVAWRSRLTVMFFLTALILTGTIKPMARIYVTEPGSTGGVGAMGVKILVASLRAAGHTVTRVRLDKRDEGGTNPLFDGLLDEVAADARWLPRPDAWYVSALYVRQFVDVPDMFRRIGLEPRAEDRKQTDPLVVFGGQFAIAPEPLALFADVIAFGDGELTGTAIGTLLDRRSDKTGLINEVVERRGFYVPSAGIVPVERLEGEVYAPIVVDQRGSHVPIIELARGCRSRCAFCPIGWAGGSYREGDPATIREGIAALRTRRVNLFAPDYSSVTWVENLEEFVERAGCRTIGRDARVDATHRHLVHGHGVKQYSFGVEGISERLRRAVGKPLAAEKLLETMSLLERGGVRSVRWYMILGLPGETDADLAEFHSTLEAVRAVYSGSLDVSQTHLQPVPHTPLQWVDGHYQPDAAARAVRTIDWCKSIWQERRWLAGQFKGRELHEHDTWLQRADRRAAAYIIALNGNKAKLADGRWRDVAEEVGIDVDSALDAIEPGKTTPWSHVRPGPDPLMVHRGWENYQRAVREVS